MLSSHLHNFIFFPGSRNHANSWRSRSRRQSLKLYWDVSAPPDIHTVLPSISNTRIADSFFSRIISSFMYSRTVFLSKLFARNTSSTFHSIPESSSEKHDEKNRTRLFSVIRMSCSIFLDILLLFYVSTLLHVMLVLCPQILWWYFFSYQEDGSIFLHADVCIFLLVANYTIFGFSSCLIFVSDPGLVTYLSFGLPSWKQWNWSRKFSDSLAANRITSWFFPVMTLVDEIGTRLSTTKISINFNKNTVLNEQILGCLMKF